MIGKLIGVALGGMLAWSYGIGLGVYLFGWGSFTLLGPVLVFVPVYLFTSGLLRVVFSGLRLGGGGLWTSTVGRRAVGLLANGAFYAVALLCFFWVPGQVTSVFGGILALIAIGFCMAMLSERVQLPLKAFIGRATRPFRRLLRSLKLGFGGSSQFAGLLEEWANPWRPGDLLLGTSLYDPKWKVGRRDDRGFITIAVAARNDERPDAQSRAVSDAD